MLRNLVYFLTGLALLFAAPSCGEEDAGAGNACCSDYCQCSKTAKGEYEAARDACQNEPDTCLQQVQAEWDTAETNCQSACAASQTPARCGCPP